MNEDVTLRELTLILEVADQHSFTLAAETAHMSQSALSRAVNETERRVGARLFHRTTRSVELTPEGTEFVRLARSVLGGYRQALNEFTLFRDGLSGVVRVAALPSVAATLLPTVVADLQRERPGIRVAVEDTLAHIAMTRLLAGEVDYAIATEEHLPDGLEFTALTSDRFSVVFRGDHRFHGRQTVGWREFAREPIVMFGPSSSLRDLTDEVLQRIGVEREPIIEAQNIAVIAGLVAAGLGVAAAPAFVLPLMAFAQLESAELVHPTVERALGIIAVRGRPVSPAATVFAEYLAAALRE
jgi:LysR family transcriptional regulator, carnitine catabolism transcriptional activator